LPTDDINMIKRINKIKKFQFIKDFSWPQDLPDFKKFNLIYGWNGSGKTTLANFLRQIERKQIDADCEDFEIFTDNILINKENFSTLDCKIKVFNQDFINETIFPPSGRLAPIFIIGDADKKRIDKINDLKAEIKNLEHKSNENKEKLDLKTQEIKNLCRDTARNIKLLLQSSEKNRYLNYECPKLTETLESFDDTTFRDYIIDQEKFDEHITRIKSKPEPQIKKIILQYPQLSEIDFQVNALLDETITSHLLTRLSENTELNYWVQKGLEIVKTNNDPLCPFCRQELSLKLIEQLDEHFNDQYSKFIDRIVRYQQQIDHIKSVFKVYIPEDSRFYSDLSLRASQHKSSFEEKIQGILFHLDEIQKILDEKKKNPFKKLKLPEISSSLDIIYELNELNKIIEEHNNRTENFSKNISYSREVLERFYAAEIFLNYSNLLKEQSELQKRDKEIFEKIEANSTIIQELEQSFLSHAEAAKNINKDLADFLDRNEILLSVKDYGYEITRNGEVTNRLSEGEKSAISFIYFLNSLKDKQFDISNGIVVIDDPISSFDSLSLYRAFAFLMNNCSEMKQLIVLTHNFTFFNEVKRWMNRKKKESEKYMLKTQIIEGQRTACLIPLDKLLQKYNSEYHFLFSIIYKAAKEEDMELSRCYPLPNISRRLLESYLAFRMPSENEFNSQFDKIEYDKTKKIHIKQFLHAKSHSRHIPTDEHDNFSALIMTQSALKEILCFIKTTCPSHYCAMELLVQND